MKNSNAKAAIPNQMMKKSSAIQMHKKSNE